MKRFLSSLALTALVAACSSGNAPSVKNSDLSDLESENSPNLPKPSLLASVKKPIQWYAMSRSGKLVYSVYSGSYPGDKWEFWMLDTAIPDATAKQLIVVFRYGFKDPVISENEWLIWAGFDSSSMLNLNDYSSGPIKIVDHPMYEPIHVGDRRIVYSYFRAAYKGSGLRMIDLKDLNKAPIDLIAEDIMFFQTTPFFVENSILYFGEYHPMGPDGFSLTEIRTLDLNNLGSGAKIVVSQNKKSHNVLSAIAIVNDKLIYSDASAVAKVLNRLDLGDLSRTANTVGAISNYSRMTKTYSGNIIFSEEEGREKVLRIMNPLKDPTYWGFSNYMFMGKVDGSGLENQRHDDPVVFGKKIVWVGTENNTHNFWMSDFIDKVEIPDNYRNSVK